MRPLGAWLEQFRRPAGVPAAVGEELESELLPVFAVLDEIEAEAQLLRTNTEREAARRADAGVAEGQRVLASWSRRAAVERARIEREQRALAASDARALEAEAERTAEELRARGVERIPELVRAVVRCLVLEDV